MLPSVAESRPSTPGRAGQLVLLISLYLAQGLPYGFFTQALPVLLREAGYSLKAISALSFLYLPWALKFLWAPYLDRSGAQRRWLMGFQAAAVVAALVLSQLRHAEGLSLILLGAFVFNFIAASQDVLTDGLAVRMLSSADRGPANAIQVGAYRIGMILGGGLLLWIFARTSWSVMFWCMSALLALSSLPLWALRLRLPAAPSERRSAGELFLGWLARARAPGMLRFALLIFCYRFGDAMVSGVLGPFLKDVGLSKETIALMKGTVGSTTSLLGAVMGGWFILRVPRRASLLSAGLAQAATFLLYILAAIGIGGSTLLWLATVLEGVVGTVATVALFTLMMDASDPEHAGTDYTLFASLVILVNSLGTFCSATLVDAWGYVTAFGVGTALALLGCGVLVWRLDARPSPRIALVWTR